MRGIALYPGYKSSFKLKMGPPEGFLPARHLGSSPTHQPCHRAWCHRHTGCTARPPFAAGVPGPRSAQRPRRWICQREVPAAPAVTCKPPGQPPLSSQEEPRTRGHQHESGDCDFIPDLVTNAACKQGGHQDSNPPRWPTWAVGSSGLVL